MPQPYDYSTQPVNVDNYFNSLRQGREDRAQQETATRQTALQKYMPGALNGDAEAQQQAFANATPDQAVQLKQALMKMEDSALAKTLQQQEKFASLAQWADTPEKWAQATQMAESEGLKGAAAIPFEQRGAKLAGMMSVKDQLAQEWKRREFELQTRETNASVAAKNAAADASRRSASESTGIGDEYSTDDPFAGLSAKARERLVIQNTKDYNAVAKENDKEMQGARAAMNDAGRFISLSRQVNKPGDLSTGTGWLAGLPGVRQAQTALDSRFSEMDAITARLVPKLREPGSGATSDFDAKMFQRGTIDIGKPGPANEAIALGMKAGAQNLIDKAGFEEAYFKARKTLVGAQDAWQQYLEANPIFDPGSEDMPKLNPSRASWRQHFGAGTQQPAAAPSPPPPPASNNPPLVRSKGEFDALPSGTVYREPDGKVYRKP
mgnify:CR=1 FL=1